MKISFEAPAIDRVFHLMCDSKWHTLNDISKTLQLQPTGVSARLRDLRKPQFGGFVVLRKYTGNHVYKYRLTLS